MVRPPEIAKFSEHELFSWVSNNEMVSKGNTLSLEKMRKNEKRQCIIMFNAPLETTECTLSISMKYTLETDSLAEIRKAMAFDIPVIQPFNITFDILPRVAEGGMPDPFKEDNLLVSQSWLLRSSITRLGSEILEVQRIDVQGFVEAEKLSLEIQQEKNSNPLGAVLTYQSHCST